MASLGGVFDNGVMAMMAQSQAMGSVSDNIANIQTTGYKRSDVLFSTLLGETDVLASGTATTTAPNLPTTQNGVAPFTRQLVDVNGAIHNTSDPLNLAISGPGMFVFSDSISVPASNVFYGRAGDLGPLVPTTINGGLGTTTAAAGGVQGSTASYLANLNGQFLLAQPVTAPPPGQSYIPPAPPTSTAGLVPIQLSNQAPFPGSATTTEQLQAVIPAAKATTVSTPLSYFDTTGISQPLTVTWSVLNPSTTSTSTGIDELTDLSLGGPGLTYGDQVTATVNGVTNTFTFVAAPPGPNQFTTLQDLANLLNSNYGAGTATINNAGTPAATMTFTAPPGSVLGDASGTPITNLFGGTAAPTYAAGISKQWTVNITDPNNVNVGTGTMAFDNVGNAIVPATIAVSATSTIPTGSTQTTSFALDLSKIQMLGTATSSNPLATNTNLIQDGLPSGAFQGIKINPDGTVVGQYAGGASQILYQIPLATFSSPNSLQALAGNVYQPTVNSGTATFGFPGSQLVNLQVGALEESNVDLGATFTTMILTQQAYGAASQVLKVADEMTTMAAGLKR